MLCSESSHSVLRVNLFNQSVRALTVKLFRAAENPFFRGGAGTNFNKHSRNGFAIKMRFYVVRKQTAWATFSHFLRSKFNLPPPDRANIWHSHKPTCIEATAKKHKNLSWANTKESAAARMLHTLMTRSTSNAKHIKICVTKIIFCSLPGAIRVRKNLKLRRLKLRREEKF
jgi:hypothetical protein